MEELQLAYAETPLSLNRIELTSSIEVAAAAMVNVAYLHKAKTKLRMLEVQVEKTEELYEALAQARNLPRSPPCRALLLHSHTFSHLGIRTSLRSHTFSHLWIRTSLHSPAFSHLGIRISLRQAERFPSAETRVQMAEAWSKAANAGVSMEVLINTQQRLRAIERTPVFEAEAQLKWLATEAKDLDADMLTDAADAAEAKARGRLNPSNRALIDARKALVASQERHAELEDAASTALLLAAPRPIDDFGALERAQQRTRQVGVHTSIGKRVAVKKEEPSALTEEDVINSNASTISIVVDDVKHLAGDADLAKLTSDDAATELKRAKGDLDKAVAKARECADAVVELEKDVRLKEAIARATYKRLHAKESVSFHHRNAVQSSFDAADKGWEDSLELREKYTDAELEVEAAVDALTVAGHAANVAQRQAAKAALKLRWVRQEEGLVRAKCAAVEASRMAELAEHAAEAEARSSQSGGGESQSAALLKKPPVKKKSGGCCGGEPEAEVASPAPQPAVQLPQQAAKVMAPRTANKKRTSTGEASNPLLELVDSFAWMPLQIGAKRVELLEALTGSGAFDNPEVCLIVADEMCALDVAAATDLVNKLTKRLRAVPAVLTGPPGLERTATGVLRQNEAKARWRRASGAVKAAAAFGGTIGGLGPPPLITVQKSFNTPIPNAVLGPVAEAWLSRLVATRCTKKEVLGFVRLLAGLDETDFSRTPH